MEASRPPPPPPPRRKKNTVQELHDLISAPYPPQPPLASNGPQSERRPDYSATGPNYVNAVLS